METASKTLAPGRQDFGDGFWEKFASDYWRRQPLVAQNPPDGFRMTPDELFHFILDLCESDGPLLRFYIGRSSVASDVDEYLPRAADGSVEGYIERIEAEVGDAWVLQWNRIQSDNVFAWKHAREFAARVFEATQTFPSGYVDVDLFVGHYPATGIGIHTDPLENFMFTLYGTKRMLVWPTAGPTPPLHTLHYEEAREEAQWLEGDPETILYWPEQYWHVGESPEPSVSLNVAFYFDGNPVDELVDIVHKRAFTAYKGRSVHSGYPFQNERRLALELPPEYDSAIAALEAVLADRSGLKRAAREAWLRRATAGGFGVVPPAVQPEEVELAGRFRLADPHPIVLVRDDGDRMTFSANGRTARMEGSSGLAAAIDRVNDGPFTLDELIEVWADKEARESADVECNAAALVYRLAQWRALTPADEA